MAKSDRRDDPIMPKARDLADHVTKFFNVAFGRKTRPGSRLLVDGVYDALKDGYSPDEIRIAFWVARCVTGKAAWLSEALRADLLPHIVLRHHGRLNNVTGKEAKRWLDEMLERLPEASTAMMKSLYAILPDDMKQGERELLARMGVQIE